MADTAVTIARARTSELSLQEQARGFSNKFNVKYSDVAFGSGSSDTVTLTLGALPSKYVLNNALVNVTTAFAGTTAFTIQVGTTTTTNNLVTAQSVLTAGVLAGVPTTATIRTATASANLVAIFTNATGGSPSALTAG
ncbi:MAG: hypothetical protein EBZ93_11035, partial [Actinobacteria bacterium]|nr:hypothetical protein [Actinomycetota bacterium]